MPRLTTLANQVTVRMYRQGHGDCFLLAFPRKGRRGHPVYVLIDCGLKPGSQEFTGHGKQISDVVDDIAEATGNHLDLVIVTHEHQDHLNGFWKKNCPYFERFTIDEAWMAWTENPNDPLANELRVRHRDQILSLVRARNAFASQPGTNEATYRRLDNFLDIEFGDEGAFSLIGDLPADSSAPAVLKSKLEASTNKQALKLIRDKANMDGHRGVKYLEPSSSPLKVHGAGVHAFVLGPPRRADLLSDEDPKGSEAFPDDTAHNYTFAAAARTLNAGLGVSSPGAMNGSHDLSPFSSRYAMPIAGQDGDPHREFFHTHYGSNARMVLEPPGENEVPDNAPWRRIDDEWLYASDALAIKLNTGINNSSLVLAFELPASRKVLLFTGDAQRGSWISWGDLEWELGERRIPARDLLGRTVLYKVGHHGSHNATLAGTEDDAYANLSWLGTGPRAGEFTAMITAVSEWARTKNRPPWIHPLPALKRELCQKAQGRVFQTDEPEPTRPDGVSDAAWKAFTDSCECESLYFDYHIRDGDVSLPAKVDRAVQPAAGDGRPPDGSV